MYPVRTIESIALSMGPVGQEIQEALKRVETFDVDGVQCVVHAELERVLAGTRAEQYLDLIKQDECFLLHFDPARDYPGYAPSTASVEPASIKTRPNCIASDIIRG